MEFILTMPQTLVCSFVLFTAYQIVQALIFDISDSEHWKQLPTVGLKQEWLGWVWATFKSVRKTKEWAFEGYSKVVQDSGFVQGMLLTAVSIVCRYQ